jgi:hypothetical protein
MFLHSLHPRTIIIYWLLACFSNSHSHNVMCDFNSFFFIIHNDYFFIYFTPNKSNMHIEIGI